MYHYGRKWMLDHFERRVCEIYKRIAGRTVTPEVAAILNRYDEDIAELYRLISEEEE